MGKSKIEWTGSTWNAIRARNTVTGQVGTFCQKISPGCANCYAETHNGRDLPHGSSGLRYSAAGGKLAEIFIDPEMLAEPLRRRKPETYFVCSLTDLFLEQHSFEILDKIFAVMALSRRHTFQVLTKRPERAREYLSGLTFERLIAASNRAADGGPHRAGSYSLASIDGRSMKARFVAGEKTAYSGLLRPPLRNVWVGVSVEDQERADERIPVLLELPAAVRFVSAEPLLGPLDLGRYLPCCTSPNCDERAGSVSLDWVIVGGESGRGARPMHPEWVRSIRDECQAAGVKFFFKQWGEWAPYSSVAIYREGGRERAAFPGIAWLADGRICCRDFSVAEHRRRIRSGEASSSRAIEVDQDALMEWHHAGEEAQSAIDAGDSAADRLIQRQRELGYTWMYRVGKSTAGRVLDGREWDELPELPHA